MYTPEISYVVIDKLGSGEIILAEEPLLVVTDDIFASTEDTEEYIYNTLNKLGAAKTQLV